MIGQFLVCGFAGWRLACLLVYERGPFDIFVWLRSMVGVVHDESGRAEEWAKNFLTGVFTCVVCMSIWTTTLMWGLWQIKPPAVVLVAAWGLALLLEERTSNKSE